MSREKLALLMEDAGNAQRSEIRGQRSEIRDQRSEIRGQRTVPLRGGNFEFWIL